MCVCVRYINLDIISAPIWYAYTDRYFCSVVGNRQQGEQDTQAKEDAIDVSFVIVVDGGAQVGHRIDEQCWTNTPSWSRSASTLSDQFTLTICTFTWAQSWCAHSRRHIERHKEKSERVRSLSLSNKLMAGICVHGTAIDCSLPFVPGPYSTHCTRWRFGSVLRATALQCCVPRIESTWATLAQEMHSKTSHNENKKNCLMHETFNT